MILLKGVKSQIDVKVEAYCLQDCGQVVTVPFVATFKTMKQSHRRELQQEVETILRGAGSMPDQDRYIREHLVDLKEVPTTDGVMEFNEDNLNMILDEPAYFDAIWRGLLDVIRGGDKPGN